MRITLVLLAACSTAPPPVQPPKLPPKVIVEIEEPATRPAEECPSRLDTAIEFSPSATTQQRSAVRARESVLHDCLDLDDITKKVVIDFELAEGHIIAVDGANECIFHALANVEVPRSVAPVTGRLTLDYIASWCELEP